MLVDRIKADLSHDPWAWLAVVLAIAFALAEFENYSHGKELSRVCELTGEHILSYGKPKTAGQEIDTICLRREPSEDRDNQ